VITDGSKCRSASETLIMTEWYMESGLKVTVFLHNTKIDDKGSVTQIMEAHHNILGFDVTMNIIV
jgi:hypothetical protein